jgi:hypothetical protein
MIDAVASEESVPTARARSVPPPIPAAARPSASPQSAAIAISSRPTAMPPRPPSSLPAEARPTGQPPPSPGIPTAHPPEDGAPARPGPQIDLDAIEALTDLPDDARAAFANAATLHTLARDEEVSHFALALVIDGEIDVSATIVDAPALRLAKNAVLRSRGSVVPGVPLRLVCASDKAVVAAWDDAAVELAFRSCPWVEDDLRTVADGVQAQAGVTMGPLGERFDESLRAHFTSKLALRKLAPGESLVLKGKPTPLAIVGVGEVVATNDGERGATFRSGDFVFPGEVLVHAPAPADAAAGPAGAVVLFGDRAVAQELLMSFPPLLEVLASI